MLETIQGEGGIRLADKKFLKELRDITIKKDILLINNLKLNLRPAEIEPEIFYKIAKLYEKR